MDGSVKLNINRNIHKSWFRYWKYSSVCLQRILSKASFSHFKTVHVRQIKIWLCVELGQQMSKLELFTQNFVNQNQGSILFPPLVSLRIGPVTDTISFMWERLFYEIIQGGAEATDMEQLKACVRWHMKIKDLWKKKEIKEQMVMKNHEYSK